jgi:hypothetical protein
MNGEDLLIIDKDQRNDLFALFRVFDDKGEIIARAPENPDNSSSYWVRPDSRIYRKDRSSLTIFDRRDEEVLDVDFLNEHAIKIRGTFREPSDPASRLSIMEDRIITPLGNTFSGQCSANLGQPDVFIRTHR